MKKFLSLTTVFVACASVLSSFVDAQTSPSKTSSRSPYGPYRYTDGWSPVSQNQNPRPATNPSSDPTSVVQAAYYQQPGSGMNLPAYPGSEANQQVNPQVNPQANNFANEGMNNLQPALPSNLPSSMPNALSGGMGGNAQPGRFNDVEMPNNMPAQNYPNNSYPGNTYSGNTYSGNTYSGNTYSGNTYPGNNFAGNNQQVAPPPQQQPQFDPYAREQQVLPPAPMQSPYRTASTDLRAVQNDGQRYPDQQQNPLNDLRPIKPTMQRGFGPNAQQMDVASGYPFVSPPPRTGNYPTSPYNGSPFRTIAYQNVVQSPQPPLSAAVANTQPTLPQNQPVVGVYPTQYQCAPGTATYPAPGAVPGTYVPPTLTPNLTPGTYSPNNSGYSPVFSLGQENYNVQLGRGIIGQPTVYVPGQPFRNFIRYLSP